MEKSLLIGDFLFVSKISYEPRVPITPLSFPFAHHTLPLTKNTKSFLDWIQLPYYRFPGFSSIKNGDVVVFNYPDGDTTTLEMQSNESYYAMVRRMGRDEVWRNYHVIARPVDKRENFIKRCIGIPGDKLQIIDQQVYINDKPMTTPEDAEFEYIVKTKGMVFSKKTLEKFDITDPAKTDMQGNPIPYDHDYNFNDSTYYPPLMLTKEVAEKLKQLPSVMSVAKDHIYPKKAFDKDCSLSIRQITNGILIITVPSPCLPRGRLYN